MSGMSSVIELREVGESIVLSAVRAIRAVTAVIAVCDT